MQQGNCLQVTPGETLTFWQKKGLDFVAFLQGRRDVILAIDITGSVEFNDEGRIRLRQIIEDSLQPGDSVIVVPFASHIGKVSEPILFYDDGDLETIIEAVPWKSNPDRRNTDIQRAEGYVYAKLARINQCRLSEEKGIRAQSAVWITDAPLLTDAGISSEKWIETPEDSPFRIEDSLESVERSNWINALPLTLRSREIGASDKNQNKYQLSIVDIAPTAQEFCTPAPGGQEICQVNAYLLNQLLIPILGILFVTFATILAGIFGIRYWARLKTSWTLLVYRDVDFDEAERHTLRSGGRITIGGDGVNAIECQGEGIHGYVERRGNQFFLKPSKQEPIFYQGEKVTQEMEIDKSSVSLIYSENNRDFEIKIQIIRK